MIQPEARFYCSLRSGGNRFVVDHDQRREIEVVFDPTWGTQEEDDADAADVDCRAIKYYDLYLDTFPPNVYAVWFTKDGKIVSVSTDLKDDISITMYYTPLAQLEKGGDISTIRRSDLRELYRFARNTDLVSYSTPQGEVRKAVFKYYWNIPEISRTWENMNIWMRLPKHPNIVSFDCLVVEQLEEDVVVGFTSAYIAGGTLFERKMFKLKWLQQLTKVVDDLNLKHGIMHQDIHPANLLVDPETDNLMLFDFDFSGRIGDDRTITFENSDDVAGVIFAVYEIITRDDHFRTAVLRRNRTLDLLDEVSDWVLHREVKLDRPVQEFRQHLDQWADGRRLGTQITHYKDAPEFIEWPECSHPGKLQIRDSSSETGTSYTDRWWVGRKRAVGKFVNWVRPPQSVIDAMDNPHLMATGELLAGRSQGSEGHDVTPWPPALKYPTGSTAAWETQAWAEQGIVYPRQTQPRHVSTPKHSVESDQEEEQSLAKRVKTGDNNNNDATSRNASAEAQDIGKQNVAGDDDHSRRDGGEEEVSEQSGGERSDGEEVASQSDDKKSDGVQEELPSQNDDKRSDCDNPEAKDASQQDIIGQFNPQTHE